MIDPITQYLLEGYIADDKSISIDLDKFESGESDKLVINGLSGSGKTTLGKILGKKYKCKVIDSDREIKGNLVKLFKGKTVEEQKKVFKEIWYKTYEPLLKRPGKAIIEGALWQPYAYYPDIRSLMDKTPQIILGTSALKSAYRRYKRKNPNQSKIELAYNSIKLNFVELMPTYKTFRKYRIKAGGEIKLFKID